MQDGKLENEDNVIPNGYRVIKGDRMNYMIYAMGRMTYLWGQDTEEFRPERWLVNGVFQLESPYKFVYFNVSITRDRSIQVFKGPIFLLLQSMPRFYSMQSNTYLNCATSLSVLINHGFKFRMSTAANIKLLQVTPTI